MKIFFLLSSSFTRNNNRKATQYKSDYSIKRLIKRCAGCVEIKFFRAAFARTSSGRWIMEMASSAKVFLPNATEKTPKAKARINFQRLSGIPNDDDDDIQRNLKVYRSGRFTLFTRTEVLEPPMRITFCLCFLFRVSLYWIYSCYTFLSLLCFL